MRKNLTHTNITYYVVVYMPILTRSACRYIYVEGVPGYNIYLFSCCHWQRRESIFRREENATGRRDSETANVLCMNIGPLFWLGNWNVLSSDTFCDI